MKTCESRRSLFEARQQRTAFLGAVTAGRGTGRHVIVAWSLFARLCAFIAALCTTLQHVLGKRALPRAQCRTCLAALTAVCAHLRHLGVLLFAAGEQRQAVFGAGIALKLTVGANLRTFREARGVFVLSLSRQSDRGDDDGKHDYGQANGTKHR